MKKIIFISTFIFIVLNLNGQTTYFETQKPYELPQGLLYQSGPGDGNSAGWSFPYGTKLTVNIGSYRNFEFCTNSYPGGDLYFRQYNPGANIWDSWRKLALFDTNNNLSGSRIILSEKGNILRFYPANSGVEIGSSTGEITFWYTGIGYNTLNCGNLISYGNILVGKTSQSNPAYKLDVSGKIRADEIVVNTTGADFVFEPNYKLRSLSELETFIRTNKHLPDIAPAKEMQQNGVSSGEMQSRLLQKVEELTLYVIEKDKEIADLKTEKDKQIADLKMMLTEMKKEIETLKSR